MIKYNNAIFYHVQGLEIELISDMTAYGYQVIAGIEKTYYHIGDQLVNLQTAIKAWEMLNKRHLTQEEIIEVHIENGQSQAY